MFKVRLMNVDIVFVSYVSKIGYNNRANVLYVK